MSDYTKELPDYSEKFIGENDLCIEIFEPENFSTTNNRPPLLFVHGAFTGSWMWSKYIPHFVSEGWKCYAMNLRSHYKSRVLDMTRITFDDYLADIREAIAECRVPPIVIGFSMGGILSEKLAETVEIAGLVLIDASISKEVFEVIPFKDVIPVTPGIILPAPIRDETSTVDETLEDIAFQRKYLTMESSLAFRAFSFHYGAEGISINNDAICCPCMVICSISCEDDHLRGLLTAEHLRAAYTGLWHTTHTGLLVGQRYKEAVESMIVWLKRFNIDATARQDGSFDT